MARCPYDTVRLIAEVQKRPILWVKENSLEMTGHGHKVKKDAAWTEIIRVLEPQYDELDGFTQSSMRKVIIDRWVNLKDAFRRALRKCTQSDQTSTYRYYEIMKFLLEQDKDLARIDSMKRSHDSPIISRKEKKAKAAASASTSTVFTYDKVQLILLVGQQPILYSKGTRGSRNRQATWQTVFRTLEPDFDDLDQEQQCEIGSAIIAKWHNLRDAYIRSLKNGTHENYIYHDYIKFLLPDQEHVGENSEWTDEDEINNDKDLTPDYDNNSDTQIIEDDTEDALRPDIETVSVEDNAATELITEEDEDAAFFISVLPSVRRMTEEDKIDFRIDILNKIREIMSKYK